jgi:tetratricopeptide (TPR) repeat protein
MTAADARLPRFSNHANVLAIASLVAGCLAVYASSLSNPMLRDDSVVVQQDPRASDSGRWKDIFTQNWWNGLGDDPIYRPLTTLSFLLNRKVFGPRPWGYRIVNVAIHAGVCIAVYRVGLLLLDGTLAAWLAAILFAVHAVHTEAVLCIVGRADMIVTLLILIVTLLLLRWTPGQPGKAWRTAAIIAVAAIAPFFKETAFVVVPLAVFIRGWQWWSGYRVVVTPLGAGSSRNASNPAPAGRLQSRLRCLVSELILPLGIAAVCVGSLLLRRALFGHISRPDTDVSLMDNPLGGATLIERLLTAPVLLSKYLSLLAWPHPLCCDYSYNQIPVARGVLEKPVLIGLGSLAVIGLALWLIHRHGGVRGWRLAVWCTGFFAITYSLISNTAVVIGTIFGERLIYLPSVAWCWAWAAGGIAIAERIGPRARWVIGGLIAAFLILNAGWTLERAKDWGDELRLWEQSVRASPNSGRTWSSLSRTLGTAGRWREAAEKMRHAFTIDDGFWEDHMHLGNQLMHLGRFEEAAQAYQRAFQLVSDPAFKTRTAYSLGQCYVEMKRADRAIAAFKTAIEFDPNCVPALNNLAYLEATAPDPALRDLDSARTHIERAKRLAPRSPSVLDTAAGVSLATGNRKRAIELLHEALSLSDPGDPLRIGLERRLEELTATATSTTPSPDLGGRTPESR